MPFLQLVGLGELHTLAKIRAVAQRAPTELFEPQAGWRAVWDEAAGRFAALTATRER
jgi:rhamnulokinase